MRVKVDIIRTLSDGEIILKVIPDKDQAEIQMPEEGKQYTVWFEKVDPDPVPEFNQ